MVLFPCEGLTKGPLPIRLQDSSGFPAHSLTTSVCHFLIFSTGRKAHSPLPLSKEILNRTTVIRSRKIFHISAIGKTKPFPEGQFPAPLIRERFVTLFFWFLLPQSLPFSPAVLRKRTAGLRPRATCFPVRRRSSAYTSHTGTYSCSAAPCRPVPVRTTCRPGRCACSSSVRSLR